MGAMGSNGVGPAAALLPSRHTGLGSVRDAASARPGHAEHGDHLTARSGSSCCHSHRASFGLLQLLRESE